MSYEGVLVRAMRMRNLEPAFKTNSCHKWIDSSKRLAASYVLRLVNLPA